MTPACPGGSTGRSRAPPRVPLESASLRAGPTYGLPGQASARAKQRPIITDKVAQALVAPVDQFLDGAGCGFQAPQKRLRLINVKAISFIA
jgi:hypothetical protein